MFSVVYNTAIFVYKIAIYVSAFFNNKARLWIEGRKQLWQKIAQFNSNKGQNIWFHVSSLGEFEQARSLIELIKLNFPQYKIILTFFSPSGYEIRKNYNFADLICYLPLDTKYNALRFIDAINPQKVFFVKYDFWYHYLNTLHQRQIPTYLVSGIFRPNQIFFKSWGKSYSRVLHFFTHFFVQNQQSVELLEKLGLNNTTVTGDTRFDRVIQIAENPTDLPIIKKFVGQDNCIVAGSTWFEDEQILCQFAHVQNKFKIIIVPHEIDSDHITRILQMLTTRAILYSQAANKNIDDYKVLIVDTIGILSSIYKYAYIAYIGGGFGKGIHNILEAAVYGVPVVFGPKYKKFKEAIDLINNHAAFSIKNFDEFNNTINKLLASSKCLETARINARKYVYANKGACAKIFEFVFSKNLKSE